MENITNNNTHRLSPQQCYSGSDKIMCVRICVLVLLIVISTAALLGRIIQYHWYRNRHYVQYQIMYTGLLIMLLLFIHSIYFPHVQWDFTCLLLIAVQLLSIYLYYSFWAFRLLKKEIIFLYIVLPVFVLLAFGFIGLFVWAVVTVTDDNEECTKPQWIIFSVSQFIIVQCLLATVIYIGCKLNNIRTVRINRWSQKAQLIFIVTVYEIITILMIIYDIILIADGQRKHCNSAVSTNKNVLISMEVILKFFRFIVPQIAIVIIFAPLKTRRSIDPEDNVEGLQKKYYYPPKPQTTISDRDPLINSIHPPLLKPSSPEEHYPSLPKHGTYSSTSGYNFYQFRSPTSVN